MKTTVNYIVKSLKVGLIVAICVFAFMFSLEILNGRKIELNTEFLNEIIQYAVFGIVLTIINSSFFDYLNHRVQWGKWVKYRLIIGIVGSISFTLIGIFCIRIFFVVVYYGQTFEYFFTNEQISFYYISLLITLGVSLIFHTIYYYKLAQETKVKEQKIIAGNASAQFESLKNQIDPHFLFNSLNVLSSLIEENPKNAQKFTASLSKIYRYVLEQKDKELVPLYEEIQFAKTYIELLKMRFEDSILCEINIDDSFEDAKVVPLSLQLLLENTIKHNIVSDKNPLKITIFTKDNNLVVQNNLQKKAVLGNRKGVGLQNIVDRYAILSDRTVRVFEDTEIFAVEIPLLTKQIQKMEQIKSYQTESAYLRAQRKVKLIKEFYSNLISYCLVIPFLIFINFKTYWGFQWFWFPMLGWGLGVTIHGFSAFGYGSSWEERKIKQLMEEEKESNNNQQKWN
uniref:histidine kinase n=1 Tax=Flavobacterium sp. TaxID=239 RepID=UPI004049D92D